MKTNTISIFFSNGSLLTICCTKQTGEDENDAEVTTIKKWLKKRKKRN